MTCPGKLQAWSPRSVQAALGYQHVKPRQCATSLFAWLQAPATGQSPFCSASFAGGRSSPQHRLPAVAERETSGSAQGASSPSRPRVCILGGGFGGLYTAVRLQSLIWPQGKSPQVTLIDQADRFVFKPLLYEVVGGSARVQDVAPSFVRLLSPYTVNFIQGSVKSVQPDETRSNTSSSGGKITLSNGMAVEYDWLVLSLGSESSTMDIPGVQKNAYLFNSIDDAVKVQSEVEKLERTSSSKVLVVGSGPAGVELATTLADRLKGTATVELISTGPQILKGLPSTHRESAERSLRRKGISVIYNTRVEKLKESNKKGAASGLPLRVAQVKGEDGRSQELEAELILWTAGSQPATKSKENNLPFPTTEKGTIKTFDTLQVVGNPRVFALGDLAGAAAEQQEILPATAQVAFQQADYAAWNIWAAIHNRALLPFRYQHLGDMMSLGGADGAVTLPIPVSGQLASAVQSGPVSSFLEMAGIRLPKSGDKGVTLDGPLGAFIRRAAYLYRQPTQEHRLEVGNDWLQRVKDQASRGSQRFSNL